MVKEKSLSDIVLFLVNCLTELGSCTNLNFQIQLNVSCFSQLQSTILNPINDWSESLYLFVFFKRENTIPDSFLVFPLRLTWYIVHSADTLYLQILINPRPNIS
jgi:hypothetical protein